jgi:hypothetical protein
MTNAELLPLLREAISELIAKPHNDLRPVLKAALDTLGKNLLYNDHGLMNRISFELDRTDSEKPVEEPAAEWWEDRSFRAVYKGRRITVQCAGPNRWYWSVGFDDHPRLPGGCIESWHDIAKSEEEAKAAAFKCARETP